MTGQRKRIRIQQSKENLAELKDILRAIDKDILSEGDRTHYNTAAGR